MKLSPNSMVKYYILLLAGVLVSLAGLSQESATEHIDSSRTSNIYYQDLSDKLAIRVFSVLKGNALDIDKDGVPLKLRPNSPISLGAGFNYKSFGLSFGLGLPKKQSSYDRFGKTNRLDIQANMYSKRFGIDAFSQLYKSYYNLNPEEFVDWTSDSFPVLSEMQVISFGFSGFYIFNSDKYSYKAAYVRNEIQTKSAGSMTLGAFAYFDISNSDSGFVPEELPDSLRTAFDLKSFDAFAYGISVGYQFTWVISKNFFLNLSLTPGFGIQTIELESLKGEKDLKNSPSVQLGARGAFGYESKHFYMGLNSSLIWRNVQYRGYNLDLATEQLRVYLGKRF